MSVTFDKTGISVEIETDGKDVISTGFVHAFGESLDFVVSGLRFRINFIDKKGDAQGLSGRVEGDLLCIDLVNFNNSIGSGTTEPMEIGFINNRKLYFAFTVSRMNETRCRRFEYTFYLGEASQ